MQDQRKTKAQLIEELNALRQRLADRESPVAPADLSAALPQVDRTRLVHQIEAAQQRFDELGARLESAPDPKQFAAEVRHELSSALEELSVASEELRQQNDELIATRHHVEIERRRYLGLFDFAPDGYLITTVEGVIREANRAAAGLLNVAAEALAGNPLAVFVAEGDQARFHSEIIDLQRGVESNTFELRLQPRGRAPVPAAVQVIVNHAPNMQSPTLHWLVQDITERRRAEQQLKEAREHFELIFNINPDAAQITRLRDGCIVDINESVTAMSGFTRQDMIGKSTLDIDLWDSPVDRQHVIAALREQGYCKNYETVFKRKDGSRFPCLLSARLYTYQGEPHVITISRDITDRKQIEGALRASEEKFRSVIEQAGEAIILFDKESRCVEVNSALERLTGVPREEWLGLTMWDISLRFMPADQRTPEAEARFKARTQAIAAGQVALAQEFAMYLPNGEIRNIRMTVFPIQMAHSTMLGSIVFDITEHKQAEEQIRRLNVELEQRVIERTLELQTLNETMQADIRQRQRIEEMLRRSEQRYRTLFESAGDAIFLAELNGQIIEVNHMACRQLGYTADQLKGQPLSLVDASPEISSVDERIHLLRKTGEQVFEAQHRRRDGSLMPVEVKSRIIEYAGHPAILGIVRDVSERKRAGQALRRYSEEQAALYHIALALNSQLDVNLLLRLIVEQATTLLSAQAGGVYLYEPQRERLALRVGVDYFSEYLGAELKPGEGLSGRVFQTRQITTVQDYRTWEGRAAPFANDPRLTAVIAVPLLSKQVVLGVLVVGGDQGKPAFDDHDAELVELFATQAATALENAQLLERQQEQYHRLQDAQSRLIQSEKMSALGRLIASISHEINNPLQAVQGCLTLIREGVEEELPRLSGVETEPWLHDLEVASTEVQRIATIVQRLRDFYRPARPGLQATDIAATINSVLALTAKQLQHSGITIDQAPAAEPPIIVSTNADQLKQVLLNLVLNAIDAMPNGGTLRVTATPDSLVPGDRMQPTVRIDFTDTGHGIPSENLPRIFEPFFTTKESGSGLGLSISYELVKSLGGDLNVMSEVGAGTTFTVRLPLQSDTEAGSAV